LWLEKYDTVSSRSLPPLNINFGDLDFDRLVIILEVKKNGNYVLGPIELNKKKIQNPI
jgi:hypothetical protein